MGQSLQNLPAVVLEQQKQLPNMGPASQNMADVANRVNEMVRAKYGTPAATVYGEPSSSVATPQNLATGLQQYGGLMSRMPMSMQRQPQGGLAGANVQPQMPNRFATLARGFQVR